MRNTIYLGIIFAITTVPAAFAQDNMPASDTTQAPAQVAPGSLIDSQGGNAIPALPIQVKTAGNISYLSGGIGDEELAELKSKKSEYNVHVLMNVPAGNYISNVTVDVHDAKGADVFNVSGTGPYLYFSLPSGKYTMDATSPTGDHHTASFTVPSHGSANVHLIFKE